MALFEIYRGLCVYATVRVAMGKRILIILGVAVAIFLFLVLVILFSPYDWYDLSGDSMEPTLQDGDVILVRMSPATWKKGEVVLFQPEGSEWVHVKRIVAVAGDQVEGKESGFYVNGERIHSSPQPPLGPMEIPEQHVFVLGDHPENSSDSRDFGPVPVEKLEARVDFVIYPLSRITQVSSKKEGDK